jgi:hypothetical protein
VQKDLATAFDAARVASGADPLYVLPTYTAMLQLRAALQRRGVVRDFWDD